MFNIAQHILHLLQTEGEDAIDAVRLAISGIQAIRSGNYVAIWDAINAEEIDVQKIIAAVQAEFSK